MCLTLTEREDLCLFSASGAVRCAFSPSGEKEKSKTEDNLPSAFLQPRMLGAFVSFFLHVLFLYVFAV